jgi:hypothetical protein
MGLLPPKAAGAAPMTAQRIDKMKQGDLMYHEQWDIFRCDAGMGEFEYIIMENNTYFASSPSLERAQGIIRAIRKCRP